MNRIATIFSNYLALCRISNLPTCVTNVLVGCALASDHRPVSGLQVLKLCTSVGLLYVSGVALNDAVDVGVDRLERPQRPIPSGRVSLAGAYRFVIITMASGILLLTGFGAAAFLFGVLLAGTTVAYDLLHKRHAWAALLMGLCRGLVYVVAASALAWPFDWLLISTFAGALSVYVIALTLVAQVENRPLIGARRHLALLMPIIVLVPLTIMRPHNWGISTASGLLLLCWLVSTARHIYRAVPRTKQAILGWLAGICLLDMFFLSLLDRPVMLVIAGAAFVLTLLAHRRILGT